MYEMNIYVLVVQVLTLWDKELLYSLVWETFHHVIPTTCTDNLSNNTVVFKLPQYHKY